MLTQSEFAKRGAAARWAGKSRKQRVLELAKATLAASQAREKAARKKAREEAKAAKSHE